MMRTFGLWAAVLDWHDGDTFYGALDQGFGTFRAGGMRIEGLSIVLDPIRHRCWGIDAPELKTGAPGASATQTARTLAPAGIYQAVSYKPDDFGRPLVDLVLSDGRLFSESMIAAGSAVRQLS